MTTTYDPADRQYLDDGDLRHELERVFDLCHGCRLCFNLCPSFPTLFDFVDRHDGDASASPSPLRSGGRLHRRSPSPLVPLGAPGRAPPALAGAGGTGATGPGPLV